MKLGYTIVYVPDVLASLAFFENAFGLKRKFLHESGTYGELDTGETTLSFAAHALGDMNFPGGHVHADESVVPLGFEIALITNDVPAAHAKAMAAGAQEMAAPSGNRGAKSSPTCAVPTASWSSCARPLRADDVDDFTLPLAPRYRMDHRVR